MVHFAIPNPQSEIQNRLAGPLIIRFGEMGLKSPPVRRRLERLLARNILDAMAAQGLEGFVRSDWGHIYLQTDAPEKCGEILKRIFGVVSCSRSLAVPPHIGDITTAAVELLRPVLGPQRSFALRVRRAGNHEFTSRTVAVDVGRAVQNALSSPKVNLDAPDVELFIEIRQDRAYLYFERIRCAGGMPLGSQGRVAVVAGLDSADHWRRCAAAAYLMMKRGARAVPVAFGGMDTSRFAAAWGPVERWGGAGRLFHADSVVELLKILLSRKCDGVVFPWNMEESVAGSGGGLGNSVLNALRERYAVFYPLSGFTEDEVGRLYSKML